VPPVVETPKPPPQGEGHGRRGRGEAVAPAQAVVAVEADPTPGVKRALEGRTSGGQRPSGVFGPGWNVRSGGSKALKSRAVLLA
jgi:hypothetical protein